MSTLEAPKIQWIREDRNDNTKLTDISVDGWNFTRVNAGGTSKDVTRTTMYLWNNAGGTEHVAPMVDCEIYSSDIYGSQNTEEQIDPSTGKIIKEATPILVKDSWVEFTGLSIENPDGQDIPIGGLNESGDVKTARLGADGETTPKLDVSLSGTVYDKTGSQLVNKGTYFLADGVTKLEHCILGLANDTNPTDKTTYHLGAGNYSKFQLSINIPLKAKSDKVHYLMCVTYDHA